MDDYIKREDAIKEIENAQIISDGENCGYCCEDILISSIPAADVRENVRGRWLHKQNHEGEWICSLCTADLAFVYGLESGLPNYCPNCGADMRGKKMTEYANNRLKPCPFCGVPMNFYNGILFAFHKDDCFFQFLEEKEVDLTEDEILDGFVKAWNRRADNEL